MKHQFDSYQDIDAIVADYLSTVAGTSCIQELDLRDINDFFSGLHEYQLLDAQLMISNNKTQENSCAR